MSAVLLLVFILLKLLKTRESNITVCESDFIGLVVEILAVGCPSYYMYNNNNSDVAKVKGRGERKRERGREREREALVVVMVVVMEIYYLVVDL